MRAPNLANVLSYPSNEINDILAFMSFMYCRSSHEQTYYVWILGTMKSVVSKMLVCNGNMRNI
jgi:hypothetical protein